MRGGHEKESDEKERWGESSPKKKRSDGGRLHHEKDNGVRVHQEKKSNGVRVHHEK